MIFNQRCDLTTIRFTDDYQVGSVIENRSVKQPRLSSRALLKHTVTCLAGNYCYRLNAIGPRGYTWLVGSDDDFAIIGANRQIWSPDALSKVDDLPFSRLWYV